MIFIELNLENALKFISKLEMNSIPKWGKMSSQRMIEHLSDNLLMAIGEGNYKIVIAEEKIPKMQEFLNSPKRMAREIKVFFAKENQSLRNDSLNMAIEEFKRCWHNYEIYYEKNPSIYNIHPYYGKLNKKMWDLLISKHFTHHFEQFDLL
jgi:oxepin-CoA hydrolase/3-oxo-5,6-dehydrosuberyl-CoA semialdehyde dehydrogenase